MIFPPYIINLVDDGTIILRNLLECKVYVKNLSEVELYHVSSNDAIRKASLIVVYDLRKQQYKILKNRYSNGSTSAIHAIHSLIQIIEHYFPPKAKMFEEFYDKEISINDK